MKHPDLPGAAKYVKGRSSFLVGLMPQDAVATSLGDVLSLLRARFGSAVDVALSPEAADLSVPTTQLPIEVQSPRAGETDGTWLRNTNMVGINVRTIGDYSAVVKYALTMPASMDSIHLLPIWEPGVVESLYGPASWNLNYEFYSNELQQIAPHLDTIERQLRATTNLLHVMGKTVGMDVIPHTDRFSECAVGSPDLFEWMRVENREIVDHSESLGLEAMEVVYRWLVDMGSANPDLPVPEETEELFALDEAERLALLFGSPNDLYGRIERRVGLIKHLKAIGLEPVPATMGVPFRGIRVDPDSAHLVVDDYGLEWPDLVITEPQSMSRVFSPLARFKFYDRVDDNANWEIDFDSPRPHVWDYVCKHYAATQRIGNFDFMRGDMSHVQMRPQGVPDVVDEYYDILGTVKTYVQKEAKTPWFAYFAETFLPPRDVFQFGEEIDHLEASLADATLGDLQSKVVGSPSFIRHFRRYLDYLGTRRTAPAFGVMTADKDDPRFDEFYRDGNEARLFTALFIPDMPSYTGLGFMVRDVHWEPVENERYTKLFVFREFGDSNIHPSKARFGDRYVWGQNEHLFDRLTSLRVYADEVLASIADTRTRWLIPPDATAHRGTAAWTQEGEPGYVFVVNYDLWRDSGYFGIPGLDPDVELHEEFTTLGPPPEVDTIVTSNGLFHRIENLAPGEARAYRVSR